MNNRLAAGLAVIALLLGGSSYAIASTGSQPVTCDYDGATLSCPIPQQTATATVTADPATVFMTATETTTVSPAPVTAPGSTVTVTKTTTRTVTAKPTTTAPVTSTAKPTTAPSASSAPVTTAAPPTAPGSTAQAPVTGWPGSSNTGVPAGTALRAIKAGDTGNGWRVENSTFYITTAGTVVDGYDIPFVVKAMANDITIKNSRIRAASYYTVNVSDPPTYYSRLTITDSEIDGLNDLSNPGIAIMGNEGATYRRLNIHGFGSSGPRLSSGTTLQDSWVHDFVCAPGEHSAGTSANDGGTGINVIHNNIDISTGAAGCASAAASIYPDFGSYDGILIQRNLFNGGAYCLYTAQNTGKAKNVRVENNTFGRRYYPKCGQYGPVAQVQAGNGNTFTGNVYDDGSPVNP